VTLKLVIKPAAESDLLEIFTWYEDRQSGLGAIFIDEIESCFDLILKHPKNFQEIDKDIHRAVTRVFPYCVFYTDSVWQGESISPFKYVPPASWLYRTAFQAAA